MGLCALGIEGQGRTAGIDARLGYPGAILVPGLRIGPVEGGVAETPQDLNRVRAFSPSLLRVIERDFEPGTLGRGVVGGDKRGNVEGRNEDPSAAKQGWDGEMASFHLRFR
jgi:hypothetical protein